jgi:ATP-binding cassette, subfamily B (MDR/TAP), member 1
MCLDILRLNQTSTNTGSVLFCTIMGNSAMGLVAPSIPDLIKGGSAAQRILETLELESATQTKTLTNDEKAEKKLASLEGAIEFQHVTFAYPSRPTITVLDDLSLSLPPNQVTAIVGGSGSGKSTLIALLERWYQPSTGSIEIDGEDIASLHLKWWRSQIALVQQEPVLFNDTILENVLNGLDTAFVENLDQETMRQLVLDACRQANAHDFISALPEGYDTIVGERASQLSGGQKQRIAIARAIISNPKILLLDEATSALDPQSERLVQDALEKVSLGKTVILVAHRLATVQRADHIVVMAEGKILEKGTHEELLAKGEAYCRLLAAQQETTPPVPESAVAQMMPQAETLTHIVSPKEGGKAAGVRLQYLPLPSAELGRRYSLLYCLWIILRDNMSTLPEFLLGFAGSFVGAAIWPVMGLLFSRLVTTFQLQGDPLRHRANFWALMFFVLALVDVVSYFVIFWLFGRGDLKIMRKYRRRYFQAMLGQDPEFSQVEGNESGTMNALLSADSEDLELVIAQNIGLVAVFVIDLIACCVVALAVYWKLALVAIVGCLPPLLGAGFIRMRFDTQAQDRCAKIFLESARFSTEAIGAVRTVSSLNLENKVVDLFEKRLETAVTQAVKDSLVSMVFFALSDTLDMLTMALVWWYGGRLISFGELSATQYFIIFVCILFGGQSAGFIFGFTSNFSKGQRAANRMLYLFNQKPFINSSHGLDPMQQAKHERVIEFQHVDFLYPSRPDVKVLKNVSLEVKRGDNICIVGPSGCGKSTVISLLERFYDPLNGEVLVHGMNIASFNTKAYRSMLGLVSQETILYRGSIRENLLLGIPASQEISDAEINAACRTANIHDFISSLPQGYNTDVGPKGTALSGGQRQRIALARALVRNPEILLLDEATSALDSENEAQVRAALEMASEGRTTVSVTHHPEAMKQADTIIVMEKGQIVETGRYADLMERRGRFWKMSTLGELEP